MGTIKPAKKSSSKTSTLSKAVSVGKAILGAKAPPPSGKKGSGKKHHHGVSYYQNKLLKIKLKKKIMKAQYGGR